MPIMCILLLQFNNMLGHTQYEMMLQLYVLARNMGWLDGLQLI